jgi:polyhydroxyalkanoate synthase
MAWNADSTRLPFRMHSEYLHQLFLRNDLAEGRYQVDGRPVVLDDVTVPVYALATERDHVSPWRSVYKIHLLCDAPIDFVLASGGHNAGIVSEPGHARRGYRVQPPLRRANGYRAPDTWREQADFVEGSWWPHWQRWLAARSSGKPVAPPVARGALAPAPGRYVLDK